MSDIFNKLLLLRQSGVGPVKYAGLINQYGSAAAAVAALSMSANHIDMVRREMDLAESLNIVYISDEDPRYPENLKNIKNHPPVISIRGNIETLSKPIVGMVGTRHATGAGLRFMHDLGALFAENGYAIASGMAMGTDTAAHKGALSVTGNAQTIAILAGGVDYIWPLENEGLYHYILERGLVISEMPVGTKPSANNFIQRNRWIAGLSDKLILGEADLKSGSMATAGFAFDYGIPVFAVPSHPSDPRSMGPNRLIKSGAATLITGIDDFFAPENAKTKNNSKRDICENELLDKIGNIPISESVLAGLVKKNIADIKHELVMLELNGQVKKTDNGYVKI